MAADATPGTRGWSGWTQFRPTTVDSVGERKAAQSACRARGQSTGPCESGDMSSRIAVIAIDAVQPRVVADFWCNVLGWQVLEEDAGVIGIAAPDGAWPTIDVVPVPENKPVTNRLLLDVRAEGMPTAAERGGLGARP